MTPTDVSGQPLSLTRRRLYAIRGAIGFVVVVAFTAPGFVEGCDAGRAETDAKFGASLAKRLETRLRMEDDTFLARRHDPGSLALVRGTRVRLAREIGAIWRVEFRGMRESHLARYGPGERSVDADVRVFGERGSCDLRVKTVREPGPDGKAHWGVTIMELEGASGGGSGA